MIKEIDEEDHRMEGLVLVLGHNGSLSIRFSDNPFFQKVLFFYEVVGFSIPKYMCK